MGIAEILVVAVAVVVAFSIKGAVGIGGPLLAIPVLAAFIGVEAAVVIITIPSFASNCWLLWTTRGSRAEVSGFLFPMTIAGISGAIVGTWLLVSFNDSVVQLILAGIILTYIVSSMMLKNFTIDPTRGKRVAVPVGLFGGWLQGTTGISSPVFATYLHAMDLARGPFVLSITLLFWANGLAQLLSFGVFGSYTRERLIAGLISTILALAVLPTSARLGKRLSQDVFRNVILGMLGVSAVFLIIMAL